MVLTTPTKDEFDKWILTEIGIVCNNIGWNEECTKDNQIVWSSSSHFRNAGIFASYETDFIVLKLPQFNTVFSRMLAYSQDFMYLDILLR